MKLLVTGAGGQLGRDVVTAFSDDVVVALDRSALDVTREADVVAAVRDHRPDVVVHTAAFTGVDACETSPQEAWAANAGAAWWVARACDLAGATMVHLSTDYVFDGTLGRPYTEFDRVSPASAYGRTKEAGEQLVRSTLERHHIVRTSWVHGVSGTNFAKTMLRLARERGAVRVVDDQCGSPTFTADLAPALRRIAVSGRYGTWHLTNGGSCTWFELARAVFDEAGVDVDLTPTDAASFGAPAPRPPYSVLHNLVARMTGLEPLPHWRDGLRRFVRALG